MCLYLEINRFVIFTYFNVNENSKPDGVGATAKFFFLKMVRIN